MLVMHPVRPQLLQKTTHTGGFTLIEIIVVVAIIGAMVATIGVSMSRDSDRMARLEAKRFHAIVNEVRDEAILSGQSYKLELDERSASYHFSGVGNQRNAVFEDGLLKLRKLERGVALRWEVFELLEGDGNEQQEPAVLISPLGEITPFEAAFGGDENTVIVFVNEQSQLEQRVAQTRLF